jgi:hypothetical protein
LVAVPHAAIQPIPERFKLKPGFFQCKQKFLIFVARENPNPFVYLRGGSFKRSGGFFNLVL